VTWLTRLLGLDQELVTLRAAVRGDHPRDIPDLATMRNVIARLFPSWTWVTIRVVGPGAAEVLVWKPRVIEGGDKIGKRGEMRR
jgi:hypothetical protein